MSLGTDRQPVAADAATTEKVRAVFNCLSKLVLGKKIYARNNPTLLRFTEEFDASLRDLFEVEDELIVSIDKRDIRWEDQVVYSNDKRDESIAFLLYKDGVGELSIQSTVTSEEMERFVDLIKDEVRSAFRDEDIVTKLWKADFENISYRVLDEYLANEFGEGRHGEGETELASHETDDHPDTPSFADKGREVVGEKRGPEPIDSYLRNLAGRSGGAVSAEEEEQRLQNMLASIFNISADELRRVQDEVFEQKQTDSLVRFINESLIFTLMLDHPSAVRDVMNVIECLTDFVVSELRGRSMAATLAAVRSFVADRPLPENVRTFFRRLEEKLTSPSVLLSIGEAACDSDDDTNGAFIYFELVGNKAVPVICKLLDKHVDPRLHKRGRKALIRVAGGSLADVIKRMDIDKVHIAHDVIELVKAAHLQEIPHVIKELMHYPDDRVRFDAIRFLVGFGDDEAALLLGTLLDDPDKNIRMNILSMIADMESPVVSAKLEEMAFSKERYQKDPAEQSEIFKALGRIGGTDIVPRLRQTIFKKSFFGLGRRHNRENKLLAIEALEQIKGPEAAGLLEELAKDSHVSVSKKAEQTLLAIGHGRGGTERPEK